MDLREYEQHKFAIAEILRSAATFSSDRGDKWRNHLERLFARLAEDRFNLVVVGRFSRGKTSLMNAILATDSLPTGIVPLTSVITSVAYGPTERVVLTFDERILTREVPIKELPQYITQQGNPGNIQRIKMAQVQLPSELLRRGFYFVDTPGLGSAIAENTRTTESFLPEADAFLLVSSYESPLSNEEFRFFRSVGSSAKRLFVVLNKHDTVSPQERSDVLAYVRAQLSNLFGPAVPHLFSVSARDGLEAKRLGSPSRLVESGLPALEVALVEFLLTEKRSELLLRMCDRVAERLREAPATGGIDSLIARLRGVAQQISQDQGNPLVGSSMQSEMTKTSSAFRQLDPCEVCCYITEAMWQFLCQFQAELCSSTDTQRQFAERGGLCRFHTWQYQSVASTYGVSAGYARLLDRLANSLHRATLGNPQQTATSARFRELLPGPDDCALCVAQDKAEHEAISAIADRLSENGLRALDSLSAICIPHLAMLSDAIKDQETILKLMDRQAQILNRYSEDMKRYALKRDAVRSNLTNDEEEDAAGQALLLVAGHPKTTAHMNGLGAEAATQSYSVARSEDQ